MKAKSLLRFDGSVVPFAHRLKTWPDVFQEIEDGQKVHEFRKNDRDFKRADVLLLEEFIPVGEHYTGRNIAVQIMSISYGPEWGIPDGWTAFSIRKLEGLVMNTGLDPERK